MQINSYFSPNYPSWDKTYFKFFCDVNYYFEDFRNI